MVIKGSVFPHKDFHKATWVSANHTMDNQTDHICINQKFRHSLLGIDAGSDHHLVIARAHMKLKCMKREVRVKFNIQQFQDIGTLELYQVILHNWFEALQDQETEDPRPKITGGDVERSEDQVEGDM